MSARPIGAIIAPLIADAIGMARLQDFLDAAGRPADRKFWIMAWWEDGTISADEAYLLIQQNELAAA